MGADQNVLRPDVPAWRAASEDEQYRSAMERAGRLLAIRSRSEHEIRTRLLDAGYDNVVVEAVIARLTDLSLIDDLAFAREWVAERAARKPAAPRILFEQLAERGIDRDVAAEAIRLAGVDEFAQATGLAARLVRKVVGRPLAEQGPRLVQMVARRGFSFEAAEEAARAVLPPEGWD